MGLSWRILAFAASVSLGVAAIDAGVAMVPWSEHWRAAGAVLRVTPLVLSAAFAALLVGAGILLLGSRLLRAETGSLFGAAGVSCLLFFWLLRYFKLIRRGALLGPGAWKLMLALVVVLALFYFLYRRPPSLVRLEQTGLFVAGVVTCIWFSVYGFGSSGDGLRWGVFSLGLVALLWLWRRTSAWSASRSAAVSVSLWSVTLAAGWIAAEHPGTFFHQASEPALTVPQGVPPILLLTIDTLRKDSLSFYNPSTASTPNLDSLARDSVVFTNAMSSGSWTLPSVTSFMTGLGAREHNRSRHEWSMQDELPRLAELLSAVGYRTGAAVDNGWLRPAAGFENGFHSYAHLPRYAESVGSRAEHNVGMDSTQTLTWLATEWIQDRQDVPFFFWLHYFDPHGPYAPPKELRPAGPPPDGLGWAFGSIAYLRAFRARQAAPEYRPPSPEAIAWYRSLYDAEVSYVDREVGKLLEVLRSTGLYDRMLIVFLADHGEEFWEHGGWGHGGSTFDPVVSVPLVVKLPKSALRLRVETPVSTARVHHTVLSFASAQPDPCVQDSSLAETWESQLQIDELGVLVSSTKRVTGKKDSTEEDALVFADRKVVRDPDTGAVHYFDRVQDPQELHPLQPDEQDRQDLEEKFELYRQRAEFRRRCLGIDDQESSGELDQRALDKLRDLGYIQ